MSKTKTEETELELTETTEEKTEKKNRKHSVSWYSKRIETDQDLTTEEWNEYKELVNANEKKYAELLRTAKKNKKQFEQDHERYLKREHKKKLSNFAHAFERALPENLTLDELADNAEKVIDLYQNAPVADGNYLDLVQRLNTMFTALDNFKYDNGNSSIVYIKSIVSPDLIDGIVEEVHQSISTME